MHLPDETMKFAAAVCLLVLSDKTSVFSLG